MRAPSPRTDLCFFLHSAGYPKVLRVDLLPRNSQLAVWGPEPKPTWRPASDHRFSEKPASFKTLPTASTESLHFLSARHAASSHRCLTAERSHLIFGPSSAGVRPSCKPGISDPCTHHALQEEPGFAQAQAPLASSCLLCWACWQLSCVIYFWRACLAIGQSACLISIHWLNRISGKIDASPWIVIKRNSKR